MSDTPQLVATDFVLPPSVVSRVDVSRLIDEIERIDNDITTAEVREKVGVDTGEARALSPSLEDFLAANELSLEHEDRRSELIRQLRKLKQEAPSVHMTFATEADRDSLSRLVEWLRSSVHPQSLVAVGLHPGLVGGVYVRTPNHVHDLSVRAQLAGGHELIRNQLEELRGGR